MGELCSLLEMRWRPSIFVWEVSCKSSRAFNLRVTDLGSGDFFFSTPFDSGFHLSSLRIFASFVFRRSWVRNPNMRSGHSTKLFNDSSL
ncbi:PREDICTED: LOC109949931 [Prunus dulcis]|uniref:PREDICTED: LOC109949931 n=1 Tax=Prunus dulcis TaxID=3755 RepID=A0A5E4FLJ9_PRUDU|nr:PREDICTED: LOC109949931 [Prunus dulcis]